jgi:hypothetical protein
MLSFIMKFMGILRYVHSIFCQVSFNMKERVYSAYTERKNRATKRREEGRRKKKNERKHERLNVRKIVLFD